MFFLLGYGVAISGSWAQQCEITGSTDEKRYEIQDKVLIRTKDGGTLSAVVIRKRGTTQPLPTLLTMDIYTCPAVTYVRGMEVASHGYVSVSADVRGKRLSPDKVVPYEHDAADSDDVIEWISHQPWSDGRVGMFGGSYLGFTAWAATKRMPAALKTIAVSAAAIPGLGLPMYNNVFLNANYGWAFYVTDNKYLDDRTYRDKDRWSRLSPDWFRSGRAYREIDEIDGTPNPLLQRWLRHPAYDRYWQDMVPYKTDFAKIDIPVLTITGYYDDAQISALSYLKQHYEYKKNPEHYLVIGPYDHFGTRDSLKSAVLRDYRIDPVAQFSTPDLIYRWMDYVLRGGAKPALLADRINYEVMGANEWRHAPSLQRMSKRIKLYLTDARTQDRFRLEPNEPANSAFLEQSVDFSDRTLLRNEYSYPSPIVMGKLEHPTGLVFASAPFEQPTVVSGAYTGELDVTINKRDLDIGVTVFEEMADGRLFHLAYSLGRASFAADAAERRLLTPGKAAWIPFETTLVSRELGKGSRLLVLLDVNKNPDAQVNYGTGGDVSAESVADAKEPLRVLWHNDSYITVPIDQQPNY